MTITNSLYNPLAFFLSSKYYLSCFFALVSSHSRTRKAPPYFPSHQSTTFLTNLLSMEAILSVFHPIGSIAVYVRFIQAFGCFHKITMKRINGFPANILVCSKYS